VVPNLLKDGLSVFQYADDTILFMNHDLEQAKNMKILLCVFEQFSALKITSTRSTRVRFIFMDKLNSISENICNALIFNLGIRFLSNLF
jgi:hypothetical protein